MLNGKNKIKQDIFSGDFLKRLLPEGKGSRMIFLAGISLLFLIVCLYFFQKNDMKKEEKNIVSSNEYVSETEKRLEEILSGVRGVGNCSVLITLESGVEYVYAEEEKYSTDSTSSDSRTQTGENRQKSYATTKASGTESPVVVTEIAPSIKGVAVICDGGGSTSVKSVITEVISKALGISGDKIAIAQKAEQTAGE